MAYYPFWAFLITLSLLASVGGFLWASRHRQFKDQERARYLPLRGERYFPLRCEAVLTDSREERRLGREAIAMLAVLAIGVAGLLTTVVVVLLKNGGNGQ